MSAHLYFSNLNKAVCYNMTLEIVSYSHLVISEIRDFEKTII